MDNEMKLSLGDRMKTYYESCVNINLIRRMPVIIRLDGRAFHSFTRGCDKPFDARLSDKIIEATYYLCGEIQGAKCAYVQSDEISILLTEFYILSIQPWFGNNLQKIVSISAAMMSATFSKLYEAFAVFDSRAFNIPKEEVCNYFVWRQKDWIRNSVQMLAQANFSHKQLQNKGQSDMHEMLMSKGINWADLEPRWKNGTVIYKEANTDRGWFHSSEVIFTDKRDFVESYLIPKE